MTGGFIRYSLTVDRLRKEQFWSIGEFPFIESTKTQFMNSVLRNSANPNYPLHKKTSRKIERPRHPSSIHTQRI